MSNAVTATADITINGAVNVCLNGKTLDMKDKKISISTGSTLSIYDCSSPSAGKITGMIYYKSSGVIYLNGGALNLFSGTVENTAADGSARVIYNNSTGAVNVSGGAVSSTIGRTIYNNSTGAINVSGGTVSAGSDTTIYNYGAGGITISGGTVQNTSAAGSAQAIYNHSTGAVNVSGGTVSATSGCAINNNSIGLITISESGGKTTLVTSSNTDAATIYLYSGNTGADVLSITGGTVQNTSAAGSAHVIYNNEKGNVCVSGGAVSSTIGHAIYNHSTGAIMVSGGTISSTGGNAIYNDISSGKTYLSGAPTITGGTSGAIRFIGASQIFANNGLTGNNRIDYSGAALTIQKSSSFSAEDAGKVIVDGVTAANKDKFTLINAESGYGLVYDSENNSLKYGQKAAVFASGWKDNLPSGVSATSVTTIKFLKSGPSGYTKSEKKYGDIEIWLSGTTGIAYVYDGTIKADNCSRMFMSCAELASIDFTNFDTSDATNMTDLFNNCTELTYIDLSGFNTAKATDISKMFYNCSALNGTFGLNGTAVKIGNGFTTAEVTNMSSMFYGCSKLTSVDLSTFDTAKVTNNNGILYTDGVLTQVIAPKNVQKDFPLPTTFYYEKGAATAAGVKTITSTTCSDGENNAVYTVAYKVTHTLTDITATADTAGDGKAVYGREYTTTLSPSAGSILPATIAVTIGGETKTVGNDYSYGTSTGTVTIPAEKVTGVIVITASGTKQYTITFDSNEGSAVTAITQNYNTSVTAPAAPSRTGYSFGGWYTDDTTFANAYTFNTMPSENITLYAKWTVAAQTPSSGDTIDAEAVFWRSVRNEVELKTTNPVSANGAKYTTVPVAVLKGLQASEKTLCLTLSDGEIDITYKMLEDITLDKETYTHEELKALFEVKPIPTPTPTPTEKPSEPTPAPTQGTGGESEKRDLTWLFIMLPSLAVVCGGAVIMVKKKNKNI